jgi:hypothetical protein
MFYANHLQVFKDSHPPETASTTDSTSPRHTSTATVLGRLVPSQFDGPRSFIAAKNAIDEAHDRDINLTTTGMQKIS